MKNQLKKVSCIALCIIFASCILHVPAAASGTENTGVSYIFYEAPGVDKLLASPDGAWLIIIPDTYNTILAQDGDNIFKKPDSPDMIYVQIRRLEETDDPLERIVRGIADERTGPSGSGLIYTIAKDVSFERINDLEYYTFIIKMGMDGYEESFYSYCFFVIWNNILFEFTCTTLSDTMPTEFDDVIHSFSPIIPQEQEVEQPSSWAKESVDRANDLELVPAHLNADYTQTMTRAEFCSLAVRLYEAVKETEIAERKAFSDTSDIDVEKMGALGVVTGIGDGRFDPGGTLTREQAATMLARLAAVIGKPLSEKAATFSDNASISSWAITQVGQVQEAGVMGGVGDNTFDPQGSYTREQSIATMLRLYDIVK